MNLESRGFRTGIVRRGKLSKTETRRSFLFRSNSRQGPNSLVILFPRRNRAGRWEGIISARPNSWSCSPSYVSLLSLSHTSLTQRPTRLIATVPRSPSLRFHKLRRKGHSHGPPQRLTLEVFTKACAGSRRELETVL